MSFREPLLMLQALRERNRIPGLCPLADKNNFKKSLVEISNILLKGIDGTPHPRMNGLPISS